MRNCPSRSDDAEFFPGEDKRRGLRFMRNNTRAFIGRSAGSLAWAGLANTYFRIDPAQGVGGACATQAPPDRRAAAECIKEMRTFPRIALGKCRIATIGMRIDGRTRNAALLAQWAAETGVDYLGAIKEAQFYVRCLEQGMSLFDFPLNQGVEGYLLEWHALTAWLDCTLGANLPDTPKVEHRPANDARVGPTPAFLRA